MQFRLLPLMGVGLALGSSPANADIAWESDYNTARAKSQASGKPMFIDVYADWCGWCKRLDSDVYPNPQVQQMARRFVMVKLNSDGNGDAFARMMRVTGLPTLMLVSSRNELFWRGGFVESSDLLNIMGETLRRNGSPRVRRHTKAAKTAPTRRMTLAQGARNWKKQPELRRVVNSAGYSGAFVLGDRGVVKLDSKATKNR